MTIVIALMAITETNSLINALRDRVAPGPLITALHIDPMIDYNCERPCASLRATTVLETVSIEGRHIKTMAIIGV